jgi:O-antigen/teichoic acid export membrane protein
VEGAALSDEYRVLLRRTAHGSMILLLGQVASTAILAVAQIIVASLLGQERLGDYTIVFVPIGVALLLQDLGISVGLTANIARYRQSEREEKNILLAGLAFNALLSIVVAFLVLIFSPQIASDFLRRPDLEGLLRIASLSIFGQALFVTTNAIFIGFGRMELQSFSAVVFAVIRGVLSPLLVFVGLSTFGAVVGQSVASVLTGLIGLSLAVTLLRSLRGEINLHSLFGELTHLLRYGLPVYMTSLVGGGLGQIYSSLMVLYVVNTQIGNYSAGLNFTVIVGFVTGSISLAIFPLFSRLRRDDENLGRSFRSAVKYSSLFALPMVGGLLALADPIIRVVYGDRFPLSASYLQLYMLTFIYIGFGSVAIGNLLNGQGETRINLRCSLITLATGVPIALYLVPNYGIIGLIFTLIISPLFGIIYGLIWIRRNLHIKPDWRSSAKIYSSVAVSTVFTLIFVETQSNLWVKLFGGAAIFVASYFILVKALRILDPTDYVLFRAILGETGILSRLVNRLIDIIE